MRLSPKTRPPLYISLVVFPALSTLPLHISFCLSNFVIYVLCACRTLTRSFFSTLKEFFMAWFRHCFFVSDRYSARDSFNQESLYLHFVYCQGCYVTHKHSNTHNHSPSNKRTHTTTLTLKQAHTHNHSPPQTHTHTTTHPLKHTHTQTHTD